MLIVSSVVLGFVTGRMTKWWDTTQYFNKEEQHWSTQQYEMTLKKHYAKSGKPNANQPILHYSIYMKF